MRVEELFERCFDKSDRKKEIKDLTHSDTERIIAQMNNFQKEIEARKNKIEDKAYNVAPVLLTVKEAAEYLKVSGQTIHNLKKSGKINFRKIGGSIRFTYQDLNTYLHSHISEYAYCNTSVIKMDTKTKEVIPYEAGHAYRIIHKNKYWIYVHNADWLSRMRFSKREFNKYFIYADDALKSALEIGWT